MEQRLAVISIIIRNAASVQAVNDRLHEMAHRIIARMGVPCREYGISVICIVMTAEADEISAFAGTLGKLDGVKVKSSQIPLSP